VTKSNILLLIGFTIIMSAGQILFKVAADRAEAINNASSLLRLSMSVYFLGALILYGIATILWILILQQVPISRAYPFAAVGFALIPAAGVAFFGETVSWQYLMGAVLIILGICVIGWANK
jgi:multidrug transporter EmrE-like cation transporter